MEKNDYKNKYLKYKQKYTNALENMYGGNPNLNLTLNNAFDEQPKAIFIVDEATNDNVRILLSLGENDRSKTINKYSDCIDMLIGISNKNVLKIIPMATIYVDKQKQIHTNESGEKYIREEIIGYRLGLQKISGAPAEYFINEEIQFTRDKKYLRNLYFGMDQNKSEYSAETTKQHLLNARPYFEACDLSNPFIIVLNGNELHFYGTLYA